jgi:hypothetical protein
MKIRAIFLRSGYRAERHPPMWFRDLTVAEAKLTQGTVYAFAEGVRPGAVEVRTNGAPKTWKTFPGCELSLKFGLRDCFRVGSKDLQPDEAISGRVRILVPVRGAFDPETPPKIVADWVMEHELYVLR